VLAAPAVSCARWSEMRTRAYRYSRSTPASPAQWFDGLCRALPGDEFLLPPSLPARWLNRSGWIELATGSLTSATDARTTRFCRTHQRRTSCALFSLTDNRPANTFTRRRCRVHHIPPRVRDDRDTPLLSRRDSAEIATDLGCQGSDLYLWSRLDDPNQIESVQQIRSYAHCFSSDCPRW
jgi:hypothetical protein